jgi:four helix bundle protein
MRRVVQSPAPLRGAGKEDNMSDQRMPFQRLDSYAAARELARRVHAAKIRDAELRDQATRAAKSAFLNLCEGLPNEGVAMRRKYFTTALGSVHEVVGAMDLAAAISAVGADDAEAVTALGERLRKMLVALMR